MKAKKLKIHVKTEKFSFPIPALRFSTLNWISKLVIKYGPSKMKESWLTSDESARAILKNIKPEDIEQILKQLEQEEPFEIVNIDTYDENEGKVEVKIYTV
jgi:hypothetical protein